MKANQPLLMITPGNPDGIGPEVVQKAFLKNLLPKDVTYLIVGARSPFQQIKVNELDSKLPLNELLATLRKQSKKLPFFLPAPEKAPIPTLNLNGYQAGWSLERAVTLCLEAKKSALCTGPIDKKDLNDGGFAYAGHTDFLAHLCGRRDRVTMMLANEELRVGLVTTHLPLKEVPKKISQKRIFQTIDRVIQALQNRFGCSRPQVAVLGLNPHAGEQGLLGKEEQEQIYPAIVQARRFWKNEARIDGPFPADSFFGLELMKSKKNRYDAVIAMYHDQGLIAVKQVDFKNSINTTLGLPIIRTSVDHGTGKDIVGKGKADPSSFVAAVKMARQQVKKTIKEPKGKKNGI